MSKATRSIDDARAHLSDCLASDKFLSGHGLGFQLPIFVAAIETREDLKSAELCRWLVRQSNQLGITVTAIDLFDMLSSSLHDEGTLDGLLAREESSQLPFPKLIENIRPVLKLDDLVSSKLKELSADESQRALLFTGLGSVYPFFRISELIALLENSPVRVPAIIFFPGEFTSSLRSPELKLFSTISEYYNYRAIDVFSYEP